MSLPQPLAHRPQRSDARPSETLGVFHADELDELRRRWREEDADGGSRLEAMLRRLELRREDSTRDAELLDLRGLHAVGADLAGLDLSGCDLSGADLSRADLKGATLFRAPMQGATLFEAELEGAELAGADLTAANLQGVKAHRAGLGKTRLAGASLFEADLRSATLTDADLTGADLRVARLGEARLRGATLAEADVSRADLRTADLSMCHVPGSRWDHADLRGVNLDGITGYKRASWIGTDVRDTDFTGAYLCRRHMLDQNYLEEFRRQGPWMHALYNVWWLTSDCGRSFVRWALLTVALAGLFAIGFTFVDVDYGEYETLLSPLYYSVVTLTTLGYGDVLPRSAAAQLLAMTEVVVGYVMLGGLLSIFSNKMARRAE